MPRDLNVLTHSPTRKRWICKVMDVLLECRNPFTMYIISCTFILQFYVSFMPQAGKMNKQILIVRVRYASGSIFGLCSLFYTLYTDLHFYLSSNVTLSWLLNWIWKSDHVSLDISSSFQNQTCFFSCLALIHTFYNQTVNLHSKNPAEWLIGIVFKL